jgi:hypothetical protein
MVSDFFAMCLAVLGVLIGFVLPVMPPAVSFLVASGVLVCAGAYIIARIEEQRADRIAQKERDALSEIRYIAGLAAVANVGVDVKAALERESAKSASATRELIVLMAQGVSPNNLRFQELTDTVRISAATMGSIITQVSGVSETSSAGEVRVTFPSVSSGGKPPA